jgi:tRNA (cytidine/uridine-2'-O-)-methyltransferase
MTNKQINVVLFQPEIPQNTGNIMRTCVGFNCKLHMIRPFGFKLDDAHLKRAHLDYYDYLDYECYDTLEEFMTKNNNPEIYYLTRYGHKAPSDIDFTKYKEDSTKPIYFMFGRESTGIPYDVLHDNLDHCFRIPTTDNVRSLNLSNCVALTVFYCLSQLNYLDLLREEPEKYKGANFIDNFKKDKE